MPYNGSVWDESNPTNSTLANEIDDVARDIKIGIRGRMAQEHIWPSSQTGTSEAGAHAYITFQAQTAPPTLPVVGTATQVGAFYVTSGALTYMNSAGTSFTVVASASTALSIIGARYSSTGLAGEIVIGSSGGNIAILPPSTTNGQVLISTSGAAPAWGTLNSSFGAWGTKSANTTYQATSDGIFMMAANKNAGAVMDLQVVSDGNASPSTQRAYVSQYITGGNNVLTIMSPIRKNDYYTGITTCTVNFAWFLPLGT